MLDWGEGAHRCCISLTPATYGIPRALPRLTSPALIRALWLMQSTFCMRVHEHAEELLNGSQSPAIPGCASLQRPHEGLRSIGQTTDCPNDALLPVPSALSPTAFDAHHIPLERPLLKGRTSSQSLNGNAFMTDTIGAATRLLWRRGLWRGPDLHGWLHHRLLEPFHSKMPWLLQS